MLAAEAAEAVQQTMRTEAEANAALTAQQAQFALAEQNANARHELAMAQWRATAEGNHDEAVANMQARLQRIYEERLQEQAAIVSSELQRAAAEVAEVRQQSAAAQLREYSQSYGTLWLLLTLDAGHSYSRKCLNTETKKLPNSWQQNIGLQRKLQRPMPPLSRVPPRPHAMQMRRRVC